MSSDDRSTDNESNDNNNNNNESGGNVVKVKKAPGAKRSGRKRTDDIINSSSISTVILNNDVAATAAAAGDSSKSSSTVQQHHQQQQQSNRKKSVPRPLEATATTTTTTTTTDTFFGNDTNIMGDMDDNIHNFGTSGTFQMMDDNDNAFAAMTTVATTAATTTTTSFLNSPNMMNDTTGNYDENTSADTNFDVAFSTSDVPFDSLPLFHTTTTTGNNTTTSTNSAFVKNESTMPFSMTDFDNDDAFNMNNIPDFPGVSIPIHHRKDDDNDDDAAVVIEDKEPKVVYDCTPHINVPKLVQPRMVLHHDKRIMNQNMNFDTSPIQNPANGNILFISSSAGINTNNSNTTTTIYEVDPNRNYIPVMSISLLSYELRRIVMSQYNANIQGIQKIWTFTIGLTTLQQQQLCEQLAAVIDLRVFEALTPMRLVVMWQRNVTSNQFDLYHITTPPAGGDFACDLSTLQVANDLLFIGGVSPKGSCIFISKPPPPPRLAGTATTSATWSANFITGGNGSVLYMSVATTMSKPYIVVALADQSITVWTYQAALLPVERQKGSIDDNNNPTTSSSNKRWLYPLCRLNYHDALTAAIPEYPGIGNQDDLHANDKNDVGYCTHMAWLPTSSLTFQSLPLLSVSFENAMVVFHIDLPVVKDSSLEHGYKALPEPTPSTTILSTPMLSPIVAKRWKGKYDHSCASWFQYGSVVDPCISILLHDTQQTIARVVFCAIHFPMKHLGPLKKGGNLLPCRILASATIPKDDASCPSGLLHCLNSIILCSKQSLSSMTLSTVMPGSSKVSSADFLRYPVTSNPAGLSSTGEPFTSDTQIDTDDVLYIYSTVHCERQSSSTTDVTPQLHWSLPQRRFWLCCAIAGDTMESSTDEVKEESGFGDSYQVYGGANAQVLCELNDDALKGLVPFRLVRCWRRKVCAVLFRCALGSVPNTSQHVSLLADIIVLVDFSGDGPFIDVRSGRDVAFFPGDGSNTAQGLILSLDGSSLTMFDFNFKIGFTTTSSFRPMVGVISDVDYIDCQRILIFSDDTKLNLAVLGTRCIDNRVCFVTGEVGDVAEATASECTSLLPNFRTGRSYFFNEGEDVFAVIGLQGDGSGYRNFAMTTSDRILILSSSLSVTAEALCHQTHGLSPIGSFAVCFASNDKIRYLCCLDDAMSSGVIASLGQSSNIRSAFVLLGVRPDRLILYSSTSGTNLCEPGQNCDNFRLPVPSTRPALLLEPMIANAVCITQKNNRSNPILHLVIEKFGRKVSSIAHGEKEGIGFYGAGLTPRCFAILRHYEQFDAASWLLTGTIKFDKSANTRLLPPWLPIGPKSKGALNSDAVLHLLANGDTYFAEYVKAPERNVAATMPRQSDPSALLCREYARHALRAGKPFDALKMLDISGAESSENLALLLSLTMEMKKSGNSIDILKSLSGSLENGKSIRSEHGKASTLLVAIAEMSKTTSKMKEGVALKEVSSCVSLLAPSLQRSRLSCRSRQRLMNWRNTDVNNNKMPSDSVWNVQCNESKHVWNEGPRKEKESLLLMDNIEDWLGRRRPFIFGQEGASAVKDRGEKTLADILNQDDDSFGGKPNDLESLKDEGWIDGVGEGRSDEANLSAYFRMSEGEDADTSWRVNGFADLSTYQNKALIIGESLSFDLHKSTSSVDEGEQGKVKGLFDLVFVGSGQGLSSGFALPAPRGSSLDVGVLHFANHEGRKKFTIEFWFFLPEVDQVLDSIVIVRRTWGSDADDLSRVARSSDQQSMLWELVMRPSGRFEFRTCGGSSLVSSDDTESSDNQKEVRDDSNVAAFGRWNHICLVLNSKDMKISECNATLYVKGVKAFAGKTRMLPSSDNSDQWNDVTKLDDAMKKSYLLFGLNHCADFRLTELRVWACVRNVDDIQSFLYEYLNAAEQKKKFKVKISNKTKIGATLTPPKGLLGSKKKSEAENNQNLSAGGIVFSLKPQKQNLSVTNPATPSTSDATASAGNLDLSKVESSPNIPDQQQQLVDAERDVADDNVDQDVAITMWDSAIPLSQQLRPSAAAALIRGPPATRHYGGNRGGLPDFSGADRIGVGGIAICGSEKTIVFRDNEDPPAVTYPIGASGAVVSDQMDDEGSEFLCCFLAKEGRMVVFELSSRTVVVELQMTTKLNFWRYLPPEAAYNSLCYMLVTPVGGFHWKPLEESPRPHQVWKRGQELQGKKVVNYEEGGSNGGDNDDICSRVGLITVTRSQGSSALEGWLIPISGDSKPQPLPSNILGACLCQPLLVDESDPFLPVLVTVDITAGQLTVNAIAINEPKDGSISLGDIIASQAVDDYDTGGTDFAPPTLAMGPLPEALCVSLSNIIVVILRRKGLVAAFEYEENELNIIAMEYVDHFVIDAVMRYSSDVGGAEIVMLLADTNNEKDGRIVSFCFRSTD